ncbi:hypothetical protein B4Q13_15730 [Lacticaseibacillus rhamnosus]
MFYGTLADLAKLADVKYEGRKAIVLLTDGVDQGSKVSLASAIEAAERAELVPLPGTNPTSVH